MVVNSLSGSSDNALATRFQAVAGRLGLSNTEIAKELEVSAPAVTKWLRTGRVARQNLIDFCDRYSVDIIWMMTGRGDMRSSGQPEGVCMVRPIPMDKAIFTNAHLRSLEGDTDVLPPIEPVLSATGDDVFAVVVTDRSMTPLLEVGCRAFFRQCGPETQINVGDVVLVKPSNRDNVFIRRCEEPSLSHTVFTPDNTKYPAIDGEDAAVIGVCLEYRCEPAIF